MTATERGYSTRRSALADAISSRRSKRASPSALNDVGNVTLNESTSYWTREPAPLVLSGGRKRNFGAAVAVGRVHCMADDALLRADGRQKAQRTNVVNIGPPREPCGPGRLQGKRTAGVCPRPAAQVAAAVAPGQSERSYWPDLL